MTTFNNFKELASFWVSTRKPHMKKSVASSKKKPVKKVVQSTKPKVESEKKKPEYKILQTIEGVVMKVPKESGLTYHPACVINSAEVHAPFWHNGKPFKGGKFLNVFFYKIANANFGKKIVGTVFVIKKTMPNGEEYKMLDVFHTPDAPCRFNFSMTENPSEESIVFGIFPDVKQKMCFQPRKHDRLRP
ncbi:MAG: hypothetical protein CR972_01790 [Candidatus Moraniibacteriota bacterium]|nr:MAG: hypothetical protein CR972_01790 [Candidatus Moranbacteria bacterium]